MQLHTVKCFVDHLTKEFILARLFLLHCGLYTVTIFVHNGNFSVVLSEHLTYIYCIVFVVFFSFHFSYIP